MKFHLLAGLAAVVISCTAVAQDAPVSCASSAQDTPTNVVRCAVERTINAVRTQSADTRNGSEMEQIQRVVETNFLPVTDFQRTTRIAVGDAWKQATPEQQQALYKQFSILMTRTYAASLKQLGGQDVKFSFKAGRMQGSDALVASTVTTPGDTQSVGYRLQRTNDTWKIYDVDMQGAWLIEVYRGQFKRLIQKDGIDGLVSYLNKHNTRTDY